MARLNRENGRASEQANRIGSENENENESEREDSNIVSAATSGTPKSPTARLVSKILNFNAIMLMIFKWIRVEKGSETIELRINREFPN